MTPTLIEIPFSPAHTRNPVPVAGAFCRTALLGAILALTAHASVHAQEPEAPTRPQTRPHAVPETVSARQWIAVTANRYATEAAVSILKSGGNAVDAAIAAQLVLNVVEPQSSGIGGGGFMLVWNQTAQTLHAWDGRETAPEALQRDDYLTADGQALPFPDLVRQGKAVGVPGLPALLAQAHEKHGTLPWKKLFEPAIRIAQNGFFVSPRLHALLGNDKLLKDDPHAVELFYPNDEPVAVGQFVRNPALAQSFRLLANRGAAGFYDGDMPKSIIRAIRIKTGYPTRLQETDFRSYRAIERAPVCADILNRQVCSMPPPSAGGIAVLQMLRLIELQNAPAGQPTLDRSDTAIHWKTAALPVWLKASRLAYEDRIRFVGDPAFVNVPVDGLLSATYLGQRLTQFQLASAVPPVSERPATTHLSVVDAQGNAVSLTSSIEDQFGSRIMVNGFLLNNQLTDFDLRPLPAGGGNTPASADKPGELPRPMNPNAIEPGKRPRSSMAPVIVLSKDHPRRVLGVTGSPGGPQIPAYVASRLYAHWWGGHSPAVSVAAPHITLRENRLDVETGLVSAGSLEQLRQSLPAGPARDALPVNFTPQTSGIHWIIRTPDGWQAVADPRREGAAMGE